MPNTKAKTQDKETPEDKKDLLEEKSSEVLKSDGKPWNVTKVESLPDDELRLISFSLSGKLNGKRFGCAMRMANAQLRHSKAIQGAEINGIDNIDEATDAIRARAASMSENHGVETARPDNEELQALNHAFHIFTDKGIRVGNIGDMFENALRAKASDTLSEDEAKEIAVQAGITEEAVLKARAANAKRQYHSTKEAVLLAMDIIDEAGSSVEDPTNFNTMVVESIASAKKSVVAIARDQNEMLSDLYRLNAMEAHA